MIEDILLVPPKFTNNFYFIPWLSGNSRKYHTCHRYYQCYCGWHSGAASISNSKRRSNGRKQEWIGWQSRQVYNTIHDAFSLSFSLSHSLSLSLPVSLSLLLSLSLSPCLTLLLSLSYSLSYSLSLSLSLSLFFLFGSFTTILSDGVDDKFDLSMIYYDSHTILHIGDFTCTYNISFLMISCLTSTRHPATVRIDWNWWRVQRPTRGAKDSLHGTYITVQ